MLVEDHELLLAQDELRVGSAMFVGELDLEGSTWKGLNHGSHLTSLQAFGRKVAGRGHHVEQFDRGVLMGFRST